MDFGKRFEGMEAFCLDDPRRASSNEIDFGVLWNAGIGSPSNWRVSWVGATGEVYALHLDRSGGLILLAERLRREVVDHAMAGWEHQTSLEWVRKAVTFPTLDDGCSGYVGMPGPPRVWVVEDGWWARPLFLSLAGRRASPSGFSWGYLGSGPYALADAILSDFLGHPVSRPLAQRFKEEIVARWPRTRPFVLVRSDVASWLETAGAVADSADRAGEQLSAVAEG